ncbi:MAG: hypothetical protein V9G20_03880 [Candidatus Promineifilaceae bacterium]|nr:hypothetical protein [Chloroflexota bacterium]
MEKAPMTDTPSTPGFGARLGRALGRFLLALLKTALFTLVIVGIAAAVLFGYDQFRKGSLTQQWVDILRGGLDESRQRDDVLQTELDEAQSQIATMEARMTEMDAETASEMVTVAAAIHQMNLDLNLLASSGQTMSATIVMLDSDLAVLQSDIANETATLSSDVTVLQADATGLRDDLLTLQSQVDEIPEVDVIRLEEMLLLFRIGEMISRARLHLAEGNTGLALEQVNGALALVNGLMGDERFDAAALTPLQERLRLAQASLPTDTFLASRDLETAWSTLDTRLTELLGFVLPENVAPLLNATATPEPLTPTPLPVTATPTLPAASATPQPTVPLPTFTPAS